MDKILNKIKCFECDYELSFEDEISDLEICSNFAEKYDNGEDVKPFEFELREGK